MTIRRAPRQPGNFTIIQNKVLLDERLSLRGLGMLVRLLSRPDNWTTNSETLAREFNCGRDQVRGTLQELAGIGYVYLHKERDEKGQIRSEWEVSEEPKAPAPEKPYSGEPAPENPSAGGSGPLQRTDLQRTDTNTPVAPKKEKKPREKREEVTLKTWLETIKAKGEMALPPEHEVFAYAEKIKLPEEFIVLAWQVFKKDYTTDEKMKLKRYALWRVHFLKAIKGNWLRLWWVDPQGAYLLTTKGLQAKVEHAEPEAVEA